MLIRAPPSSQCGTLTRCVSLVSTKSCEHRGQRHRQRYSVDAPFLTSYYGNNQAAGIEESIDTVTVRDRHALVSPRQEAAR
jgi:hypothetical protein